MTSVLDRVAAELEQRANPPYLKLIRDWAESDCTSPNPEHHPSELIAPTWRGPAEPCADDSHLSCNRCHSCATCRPEQRRPLGSWNVWMYLAGRGAGKTRSAAEEIAAALVLNRRWRVAILAPTYADARDTCVEGESGLIAVFDRWGWQEGREYIWNRSLGELKIKSTRSRVKLFSAEKPARLRGPQHHLAWVDELAQVVKHAADAWDMLKFGLRLGKHPRVVVTTTPLPVQLIKDLLVDPRCAVTRGKTDDNAANLPAVTLEDLHKKYDNTRLGRQELDAEILDDTPGALWARSWIDGTRVKVSTTANWSTDDQEVTGAAARAILDELADLGHHITRTVIALDPAVTSGKEDQQNESKPGVKAKGDPDESGIIVVARTSAGRYLVLADYTIRDTPTEVMARVIQAYDDWDGNAVIVEVNNGGEWVSNSLFTSCLLAGHALIPCEEIRAKKAKRVRAEPVSMLYGQKQVSHVGTHTHLEDQLCVWLPSEIESPDRMDAMVYGVLYLDGAGLGSTLMTTTAAAPQIPRHMMRRAGQMPTTSVRTMR